MDDWRFREVQKKDVQFGDIFLYDATGWVSNLIKLVSKGVNHVAIAIDPYFMFEARGFRKTGMAKIRTQYLRGIYRPLRDGRKLSETAKEAMRDRMATLKGEGYGYWRNFQHFLSSRLYTRRLFPKPKKGGNLECSGVVASILSLTDIQWYESLGLDPRYIDEGKRILLDEKTVSWWTLNPSDIFKNIIWRLVK